MDQHRKAEIRQWIVEANMALYRDNANDAYEALNKAAFAAGTCFIEQLKKVSVEHPSLSLEDVKRLYGSRERMNPFESNSIECAIEQLEDTGCMTKQQESFIRWLAVKYANRQ